MSKKGFYVQLHLHTSETSKCGRATGAEMARACKAAGYDLIAITDHFFNANIACEQDIPWEDKVEFLFRGYYAAKAEGADYAVDVYPYYGSDVEATLRSGVDIRHGLIGAGVYASHGYERSHIDGVHNTLLVLKGYLNV